jgi:putative ABC transport system substrate-binding protein
MRRRESRTSPPPLRGRSIRQRVRPEVAGPMTSSADREGGDFYRCAIQLPPSLTLPHQACIRARASAARVGGGNRSNLPRRAFFASLAGAAIAHPFAAYAQKPTLPMIGFLNVASADGYQPMVAAFRRGLQEMGYVEGQNVVIEYRWADGQTDRLPALAAELVHHQVAVIAATSTPAALAAKAATAAIPIVFESGGDPIRLGLVASLSQPGGNVTGVTQLNAVVSPKRLELLHELLPTASTMALLVNPANPTLSEIETNGALSAARNLGMALHILNARSDRDLEEAFLKITQLHARGLVIGADAFFTSRSKLLAALCARYAVPAVYENREFVTAGGLLSYGGIITDSYRLTGVYVARVLKGEKPAELPVQQATKIELYINLKTAKALGITVPLTLSGRADEVIE